MWKEEESQRELTLSALLLRSGVNCFRFDFIFPAPSVPCNPLLLRPGRYDASSDIRTSGYAGKWRVSSACGASD